MRWRQIRAGAGRDRSSCPSCGKRAGRRCLSRGSGRHSRPNYQVNPKREDLPHRCIRCSVALCAIVHESPCARLTRIGHEIFSGFWHAASYRPVPKVPDRRHRCPRRFRGHRVEGFVDALLRSWEEVAVPVENYHHRGVTRPRFAISFGEAPAAIHRATAVWRRSCGRRGSRHACPHRWRPEPARASWRGARGRPPVPGRRGRPARVG